MAQGVLSAKLDELDQKFIRLHNGVRMSETADPDEIRENVKTLLKECTEARTSLRDSMRGCKERNVKPFFALYDKVDGMIDEIHRKLELPVPSGTDGEMYRESLSLLAEYMIDLAMQAADEALLVSMRAISIQKNRRE